MLVAGVILPLVTFAQAQITTKKMKLEDFPEKTMKVVLGNNVFINSTIEEAVKDGWTLSPYEFCTLEEFETLKGREDYYFLMCVTGQFQGEKEPGLTMLSLVKGGKGSDESIDNMLEVVTLPICSARYPSGREVVFMPALIDIIQTHVQASMEKDYDAYIGLGTNNMFRLRGMRTVLSESDLGENLEERDMQKLEYRKMEVLPEEDVDKLMEGRALNTIVSYVVSPYDAEPGSYCYKMLIDAGSNRLYYFKRHKISPKTGTGFQKSDIFRITNK